MRGTAKEKVYWPSADGDVDIDTMSIQHLRNVLKKIVRTQRELALDSYDGSTCYEDTL